VFGAENEVVDPSFLFILANKKIEQRFFEYKGRFLNPEKGLVIDGTITRPDRFEFYLVAHSGPTGLQGPVRYEVIAMENWADLDPKDLYDLTYNLCYGYFNLQASIKIPAPLMYAHALVNQIAKISNKKDVPLTPDEFNNKLYCI
jgi:hypothetical protein